MEKGKNYSIGEFRESNPGPLAPKARIIPLDQTDLETTLDTRTKRIFYLFSP